MIKTISIVCLVLGILFGVFGVTAVMFSQTAMVSKPYVYERCNAPFSIQFSVGSSMMYAQRMQNALPLAVIGTGSIVGGILFLFMSLYASVEQRKMEMRDKMRRFHGCKKPQDVPVTDRMTPLDGEVEHDGQNPGTSI
ncbi:hypothetical protein [Parasphaerochaeta coccoides]|uniref:Uncharacterized protein n=1 Tax=Parasphaerochaeta coccoides (strain ATCC BAA-1237 / DSM 17374 / SPN1) TaxID=760011 RepID=F4GHV5_PARC1|nr:hypothetical protein [Parasphaerochaeta coccoides]AEC02068.1 hypothetical protein Spico_0844 [Parasphaerochaeta coccoides DSM 17374]